MKHTPKKTKRAAPSDEEIAVANIKEAMRQLRPDVDGLDFAIDMLRDEQQRIAALPDFNDGYDKAGKTTAAGELWDRLNNIIDAANELRMSTGELDDEEIRL